MDVGQDSCQDRHVNSQVKQMQFCDFDGVDLDFPNFSEVPTSLVDVSGV